MVDAKNYIYYNKKYTRFYFLQGRSEMKTCCVTGHRDIPLHQQQTIRSRLEQEVERAIADGYICFLSGFAEGIDLMFAKIIADKCRMYPYIRLEAVLPYRGRYTRLMKTADTRALLDSCTAVQVVSETSHSGVYHQRNRYMVERSSRVIAVYDGRETGGTVYTVQYARRQEKDVRMVRMGSRT